MKESSPVLENKTIEQITSEKIVKYFVDKLGISEAGVKKEIKRRLEYLGPMGVVNFKRLLLDADLKPIIITLETLGDLKKNGFGKVPGVEELSNMLELDKPESSFEEI